MLAAGNDKGTKALGRGQGILIKTEPAEEGGC